jgi:hypothetical protein
MNSQFLLEKLEDSEEYKKFMKENSDAYLCSAFFIIDLQNHQPVLASSCNPTEVEYFSDSENKFHFDYYLPSSKKTFSFEIEDEIKLVPLERFDEKVLEKVSSDKHFDFDDIYDKIMKEMEEKKINNKILKMIFSLQNFEGKDTLFGTIMLSSLALLKMTFDISEDKIVEFEKKSFFDMMKIVKK